MASTELVTIAKPSPSHWLAVAQGDMVGAFLAGRSPRTLRAYAGDLAHFARFLGATDASAAVELLLGFEQGGANAAVFAYRADMTGAGLSSATIARRLAALRSIVQLGRTLGRIAWALDVPSPKTVGYRDTAGPGVVGWEALWEAAKAAGDGAKARRDRAILRLLTDRALRRGEMTALDLADVALGESQSVAVIGKGHTEKERLTINPQTSRVLAEWIEARGPEPGPLFIRLDRAGAGRQRLTGEGVRLIVAGLSRAACLARTVRPHGLRHHAITRALNKTNGNVRDIRAFSRHADIKTLMIYDDRRTDVGGEITRLLGEELD